MADGAIRANGVKRLFGNINEHQVVEIIESGAMTNELEKASAQLPYETDVLGDLERLLTGRALRSFRMLRGDEE